ncbi:ribonucleotide reductase of class Ib (aerobic), alpha subunit [Mycoplasma haemofelis str. Langford 1]|uniref:Ribonucleoside-diphosphate reductase n=2 Tax=Mycoplasma haemofelis TaxID=29501 RepID=F6FFK6_MYCHI|nr:class 1b ribonucleoside-diphosphate reductase subunit alpha [Mycoplasma haemofelis]AEG72401.1 Ribonucleoside-diphosphate reductase, alpha subunit [Mycoplasma haemofelis Ohio2]CBY92088.1 ribonucleotide reductase of class Ib (aerobic), alpha subunit [Mycoplasma haemofelis str. Langford 1]
MSDHLKRSLELNNMVTYKSPDGFFDVSKDLEAIAEYEKYVDENFATDLEGIERIRWLIENNFYVADLINSFTDAEVIEIIDLVKSYNFRFKSYMSIKKFYDSYALRTDDKKRFLERYDDRIIACALFLGRRDFNFAKKLAKSMIEQKYQPATPTFSNAGKKRSGELVSCFLLEVDDSLNSINYIISTAMQLSKIGGGVAINLSKLRARGAQIKHIEAAASGVIPVIKILENVFDYADQLGQRPGAGAAYLSIFHWDLIEFLDCKKINADEKSRIQTLSLGLLVPNKFIDLCIEGADYYLFEPYTVFKKYGVHMSDMDMSKWYEVLAHDPDILKKSISARDVLNNIAKTQFESGYPYIIYIDTANKKNPLKKLGQIKMSNLCTEIFQIQETSTIKDYGDLDDIRYDVSCNLGSLNINSLFEGEKNLEETIEVAMRALSMVSDISSIANAPGVRKANSELHSVGLGAMNLAGFLAKNKLHYDSPEAVEFASVLFAAINFFSIKASCLIAQERKKTFEGFEKSDYYSGVYFLKYLENDYLPKSDVVKELFKDMKLPTREDWQELAKKVKECGLYNAYRLAIAPTQTISYLNNSTPSIAPVVDVLETRLYGNSLTYYPMPFLNKDTWYYYKSAYLLDQKAIIDMVSAIQEHVDQGISTVLYVTNNTSTRDLVRFYIYAWHKGLKSLYYTRTKNLEIEECLSCAA